MEGISLYASDLHRCADAPRYSIDCSPNQPSTFLAVWESSSADTSCQCRSQGLLLALTALLLQCVVALVRFLCLNRVCHRTL